MPQISDGFVGFCPTVPDGDVPVPVVPVPVPTVAHAVSKTIPSAAANRFLEFLIISFSEMVRAAELLRRFDNERDALSSANTRAAQSITLSLGPKRMQ